MPDMRHLGQRGREHISADGNLKQEFREQARKLDEEERRAEEEMAKAWEEEVRLASEFWAAKRNNG